MKSQARLRDLGLAQFRMARQFAALTGEYRRVLADYLGERGGAPRPAVRHASAIVKKAGRQRPLKKLDELDAPAAEKSKPTVKPDKSIQPVRPLKFEPPAPCRRST